MKKDQKMKIKIDRKGKGKESLYIDRFLRQDGRIENVLFTTRLARDRNRP